MDAIIDLFTKGGIYIFPLILCSIFGLAIFLQKFNTLQRKKLLPEDFLSSLYNTVETKGLEEVKTLCASGDSAVARMALAAAQNSGKSKTDMHEAIETAGKAEAKGLEKYIDTLLAISSISTLIGLLGTISGMIKVFAVISEKDIVDPPSLAGGISEALYTTALGLTIAIPAYIAYKYTDGKFRELISELEDEGKKILEAFSAKVSL